MATVSAARPTASSTPPRDFLAEIASKGSGLPNRYILHAVEGWGKTSLAAQAPKPIFLQSKGETGLETLIDSSQLKETPHLPECKTYEEVRACLVALRDKEHDYRTLVIDTVNGIEALIHQFVCTRDFGGDWSEKGFLSYKAGYEVSLPDVRDFLGILDEIRLARKMTIFLLAHTRIKPFKNPEGPDYDKYTPDMHEKTWGLMKKWSDAVFFGNFEVQMRDHKPDAQKAKAIASATPRILYTEGRAAFDAKNRLGLPIEMEMGGSAIDGWAELIKQIKASKEKGK